MKRFLAALRTDILIQFRNGFYLVGGIITVGLIATAGLVPKSVSLDLILPLFIVQHSIVTTFFFAGALILLEKSENVQSALAVTPLLPSEYLWSKIISLQILVLLETLPILLILRGIDLAWAPFFAAIFLLSILFSALGIALAMCYHTMNTFLPPSIGAVLLLLLPYLDHLELVESPFFFFHPVQPIFALLRAALQLGTSFEIIFGLTVGAVWAWIAFIIAGRMIKKA